MRLKEFTVEKGCYLLIISLAVFLRFLNLGKVPLTETESILANGAHGFARGIPQMIGSSPLYTILTGSLFYIMESNEFLARFWPALAGSLIVLLPIFIKRIVGRLPALLLAIFLALDPGLLATSRQASSVSLALLLMLVFIISVIRKRPIAAGLFGGLAFISGPEFWFLILSVGLAAWASGLFIRTQNSSIMIGEIDLDALPPFRWKAMVISAIITLMLTATAFFFNPGGLVAIAEPLLAFIRGWRWSDGYQIPIGRMILALVIEYPLVLVLGTLQLIQGGREGSRSARFFDLWWIITLILVMVYPTHQVGNLALTAVPMAILASKQAARIKPASTLDPIPVIGQAVLVVVMILFAWLNIISLSNPVLATSELSARQIAIVGSLALLLVTGFLLATGWGWEVTRTGLQLGGLLLMVAYSISASWKAAGLGTKPETELWVNGSVDLEANLLNQTISDMSLWNKGSASRLDIAVVDVTSPGLVWNLRGMDQVTYTDFLPNPSNPALIITRDKESPNLETAYRGQDFMWDAKPAWSLVLPGEWLRWVCCREITMDKNAIILWVRNDLFPGMSKNPDIKGSKP